MIRTDEKVMLKYFNGNINKERAPPSGKIYKKDN